MDRFGLQRFVDAQERVYPTVLQELRAGKKRSHWIWFVFPQIAGLGRSPTAQHYAIASLDEARAYLAHPVLGVRLRECAALAAAAPAADAYTLFGSPDDLKFRSSMTLFAVAEGGDGGMFCICLEKYFGGQPDAASLALLERDGGAVPFRCFR